MAQVTAGGAESTRLRPTRLPGQKGLEPHSLDAAWKGANGPPAVEALSTRMAETAR